MKIELKNIQYAAFASQETNCYEASLYVDGIKIGTVSNEGFGGPDNFYGDQAAFKAADDWCKANLPPLVSTMEKDGFDHTMQQDLELVCGRLVDDWLALRDLKKALKKRALFTCPGEDGIFALGYKGTAKPDERLYASVKERHPGAVILNTMPESEALAVYRANAR